MDWTVSLGDNPGVEVFNRDGIYIAVTAMAIGLGILPSTAKFMAEQAQQEAKDYQASRRDLQSVEPMKYQIKLLGGQFIQVKSAY